MRVKINEVETRKATESINKTKSQFSKKINKIDKPWLDRKKKKYLMRNEKGDITTETTEIHKIIRDNYD